jgi:hypothetical protein
MRKPTCVDLRPWADEHRYRWRYEEGHSGTELDAEWYVEVICRYGLIYPKGGNVLIAYANAGVKRHISALSTRDSGLIEHHQWDGNNEGFRFAVDLLDQVAAILKPKKLQGSATLTLEQLANLQKGREVLEKQRQESPETPQSVDEGPK